MKLRKKKPLYNKRKENGPQRIVKQKMVKVSKGQERINLTCNIWAYPHTNVSHKQEWIPILIITDARERKGLACRVSPLFFNSLTLSFK